MFTIKLPSQAVVLCLFLAACGAANSPEGVADEFLFRYFIELNQRGALELSVGLAEKKLREEIELTQNVRMQPNLDLAARKPFIDYKLVNTRARGDDSVTLFYDVTVETKNGAKYASTMVVTATEIDGQWKVNNFESFRQNKP